MRARQPPRPGAEDARSEYMTAAEAARALKVKPQTLYTYVSRGLIRSLAQLDRRSRLYYREDVEKVRARSEARHGASAEAAMRWGQPVVSTAITELTPDGPRYRGHAALDLARAGLPFENVAELLWTGVLHRGPMHWHDEALPEGIDRAIDALALQRPGLPMLRIYALATTILGAAEAANSEIRRGTTIPAARQLVLALAGCLGYLAQPPGFRAPRAGSQLADDAARILAPAAGDDARTAINAALVLCADHELSSSTFAARVAASTGAELRACVLA